MYYGDRLIIGYIFQPGSNRYIFQLVGGEEIEATPEEFAAHWQAYRDHEKDRAAEAVEHYHPLPVTLEVRLNLKVSPAGAVTRRQKRDV